MSGIHICVYAMCKNESAFVSRFMDSMSEADSIVVLDTGSTDDTVEKLKEAGATVAVKEITPWRFDVARNESMKLIPKEADVCVCVDLDEVFEEGWADGIRRHWVKGQSEKGKYLYSWNHDAQGKPVTQIWYEKMHDNSGNWHWCMPVHEALTFKLPRQPNLAFMPKDEVHLHHYPDSTKSRGQYLDLMKMGVAEDPEGYMQRYYLAREYTYYRRWQDAVNEFEIVVSLPSAANFVSHQAAAYGFMGNAYSHLGDDYMAEACFIKALKWSNNQVREPFIKLMEFYYNQHRWYSLIDVGLRCLEVPYVPTFWYEDSNNYGYKPHDYLSIAYWNIGMRKEGKRHLEIALEHYPDEPRLLKNMEWFKGEKDGHSNDRL